jgi:hypothetical protein
MRLNFPVLGGASAVIAVFWATVPALNFFIPLCPRGFPAFELKAPFQKHAAGGAAYIAAAPSLQGDSDTSERPARSTHVVCENRYALGPAHSSHTEISTRGKGRFSHWGPDGFIFSASDNSDPNTNGRTYLATRSCDEAQAAGLCGSWSGEVSQNDPPARYPVEMQLYGNGGNIAYSSAGCGGQLDFLRTDGTSYWYREHMSYGGDTCTDGGIIEMRADAGSEDNTSWNWTWTGSDVPVTGVLRGAGVRRR